jgi:hypothetical protein
VIRLELEGDAVLVPVWAQPGASRSRIAGVRGDAVKVAVTKPARGGEANAAVRRILADTLKVRPSAVTLVSGASSREKLFRVRGVTPEQVRRAAEQLATG